MHIGKDKLAQFCGGLASHGLLLLYIPKKKGNAIALPFFYP